MLKEKIRGIRYKFIDMIVNTYEVSVNSVVDSWIDRRLKELVNATLEEAAQEVLNDSNIHSLDAGRLAHKIHAMKVQ